MGNIQDLRDFIERAERNRKYPESSAQGLRAALKLFEEVLNDEERQSLELFKTNLNQIYHSVNVKNAKTITASSLATYKSRVMKVVADYEKYGIDPTKMANWTPKLITRAPKKQLPKGLDSDTTENEVSSSVSGIPMTLAKIELPFASGRKAVIMVPSDMSRPECMKIKGLLDSLTNDVEV